MKKEFYALSKEDTIKKNLKFEIEHCGKSKTEIAKKLGISKPTLSQYLSGRIMPSLPPLPCCAKSLIVRLMIFWK